MLIVVDTENCRWLHLTKLQRYFLLYFDSVDYEVTPASHDLISLYHLTHSVCSVIVFLRFGLLVLVPAFVLRFPDQMLDTNSGYIF